MLKNSNIQLKKAFNELKKLSFSDKLKTLSAFDPQIDPQRLLDIFYQSPLNDCKSFDIEDETTIQFEHNQILFNILFTKEAKIKYRLNNSHSMEVESVEDKALNLKAAQLLLWSLAQDSIEKLPMPLDKKETLEKFSKDLKEKYQINETLRIPKLEKILFSINTYDNPIPNEMTSIHHYDLVSPTEGEHISDLMIHKEIDSRKIPQSIQWKKYNHFTGKKDKDWDIHYIFSNGKSVSGENILFHTYSKSVHRELLPTIRDLKGLEEYARQGGPFSPDDEYRLSIIETLWRTQKLKNLRNIEMGFFFGTQLHQSQKIYPIQTVEFLFSNNQTHPDLNSLYHSKNLLKIHKLEWESQLSSHENRAELSIKPQNFNSLVMFKNFAFDLNHHTLYFHPFRRLLDDFLLSRTGSENFQYKGNLLKENWNILQLDAELKIEEELQSIFRSFPFLENNYTSKITNIKVLASELQTHFEFEKDRYHLMLNINKGPHKYKTTGFPTEFQVLINVIKGALLSDPFFELKNLKRLKSQKNNTDKKLLKHRGVSLYLINEIISFVINSDSKFNENEFIKRTLSGINKIFLSSLKLHQVRNASDLSELCSKKLIKDLEEWILNQIITLKKPLYIYCDDGALEVEKGQNPYLKLLQSFISFYISDSKGECFLKPNKKYFPDDLEVISPYKNSLIAYKPENIPKIRILLKYTNDNIKAEDRFEPPIWLYLGTNSDDEIFVHKKKLQTLNDDSFKAEFNLKEADPSNNTTNSPIDWFSLNPTFFLNGEKISTEEALKFTQDGLIEHNGEYFILNKSKILPSSKALHWFWNKMAKAGPRDKKKKFSDNVFQLPRSQTLELLALRNTGVVINGGPQWKFICDFYDNLKTDRKLDHEPATFKFPLKQYQREGLTWMMDLYRLHLGGILADDMGLGKTIQTLAFFETLRLDNKLGHSVVVVPTSLTYNWTSEAEKFAPDLKVIRYQTQNKKDVEKFLSLHPQAIVVCSYGLFTSGSEFFEEKEWNIQIFDEGQHLKNIKAKRTTAARKSKAHFKMCLTGTPIENHYDELYSLLDLTAPGSLGDLDEFRKIYIHPVLVDSDEIQQLRLKIRPLVLRRTKKEILKELPDKTEVMLKIPFESEQKKLYRDIAISWNNKVKDALNTPKDGSSQLMMLTALLRLRQACSDPSGIPGVNYNKIPPKIETLVESLKEITEEGHSALVFTQFMSTLERIERLVKAQGIDTFTMHGAVSQKKRETTLKAFNENKKGCVFIMTLKTGGVGLNLTKANYVFHLEPWWNPSVENQATDRTHRIGQKKAVTIYRLLMQESVEEKVEVLKQRKAARFSSLFGTDESPTPHFKADSGLTQSDFEFLIK